MSTRARILVIDDERAIRFGLRDFLEHHEYDVVEADTCAAARKVFHESVPDAVILDYSLRDGTALELLPDFRAEDPSAPVIVLTAHGSIDLAVRAIKEGAEQFLTKPVELPALLVVIERALEHQRNSKARVAGTSRDSRDAVEPFHGSSAAMRRLERDARLAIDAGSAILLLGETGTGKGVLARWIHRHGRRSAEPLVEINCAGLSRELLESELFGHEKGAFTGAVATKPGLLEVAHRGTLFLDEIGDMDQAIQARLLKVLEEQRFRRLGDIKERRVDIRLISATHHDVETRVKEGTFRGDLYYRIGALPLRVPPLRERTEDIGPLASGIVARLAADLGRPGTRLTPAAIDLLESYEWPGNLRELRNVLERALLVARGPVVDPSAISLGGASLPASVAEDDFPLELSLEEMERRHIERVLRHHGGHVERAAVALGISRSTLYQRIKQFNLDEASSA
ncbi:MAG TPA: sigma-54 dependent transcriptional regulator [Gemmatimonadales bacterium]|nr:sigma-54 dependent transcriptional regulator [Gemmatimonadales bacterium]